MNLSRSKITISFLIGLFFQFYGCQISTHNFDTQNSQPLCEKLINSFYSTLIEKKYENTFKYYHNSFFLKISPGALTDFYKKTSTVSGDINTYKLITFQQYNSVRDSGALNCIAIYRVNRSKGFTEERIILKISSAKDAKILRYNVGPIRQE
jgi:hypothetical protein